MLKIFSLEVLSILLLFSSPILAQTKTQTHHNGQLVAQGKTGDSMRVETVQIQVEILATYFYDMNENLRRITFTNSATDGGNNIIEMPYPSVEKILEAIVPFSRRGKLCGSSEFQSGRNSYRTALYEKVLIGFDYRNATADDSKATVGRVEIKFQSRMCPEKN